MTVTRGLDGTFFEFRHHNGAEGKYWNPALAAMSARDWRTKVREIAGLGMEYIVLMASALDGECYFESSVFPKAQIPCANPIEELLSQADESGLKVFVGNGFFGDWRNARQNISDSRVIDRTLRAMEELTAICAPHKSFYGWYFPDETCIVLRFSRPFIKYVNLCSARSRELTPSKRTLIAPYGTNLALTGEGYVRSLCELDVDFIAYQDEVGVRKTPVRRSEKIFERLARAHEKAGRSKLWADIELFDFEGMVYKSALLPADAARIARQIKNAAPYAEKILGYQYIGLMNPADSPCFAGHPDSVRLYESCLAGFES